MPVKNVRRDLPALEKVAKDLYGRSATLVDRPKAGDVGALDAADKLVRSTRGGKTTAVLGAARAEDLVFRARVVQAAYDLAASGASFSGARDTDAVNTAHWRLDVAGEMHVRKWLPDGTIGSPAKALTDIFQNGDKYGFECATAMMVIYHKAILDHVGAKRFDEMFTEPRMLGFFRWSIEDDDYVDVKKLSHRRAKLMPGSHYYFANPGAEKGSAWGGENVIYLGDGLFYAHGVVGARGDYVVTEKEIVDTLASLRRPGSREKPKRIALEMHMDGLAVSKKAVPEGARA